jgi:hypothetical protein
MDEEQVRKLLEHNPQIDPAKLEALARLSASLEALGSARKGYELASPYEIGRSRELGVSAAGLERSRDERSNVASVEGARPVTQLSIRDLT